MATNGGLLVGYCDLCDSAFYFQDLDEDSFQKSPRQPLDRFIQSEDNKFLILNAVGGFQVKDCSVSEQRKPGCMFCIQIYNDGRNSCNSPVILYTNKDDSKMMVCCKDDSEIYPEAMELPTEIGENGHRAIFYLIKIAGCEKYKLKSSLYPNKFLGFEPDKDNPSFKKLVLRDHKYDEIDQDFFVNLHK
ncbi:hypothetical protein PAMP_019044 [Pampus punctatissimus]